MRILTRLRLRPTSCKKLHPRRATSVFRDCLPRPEAAGSDITSRKKKWELGTLFLEQA